MHHLSLAAVVLAHLVEANEAKLDLLARVSVLEGIADIAPGTWARDRVPAEKIVDVYGEGVLPTWLSRRNTGLVSAVRFTLEKMLRDSSTSPDDILQDALVGFGASGRPTRLPFFFGVGKAPGFTIAKVRSGDVMPADVKNVARAYARRRALDVLRAEARRPQSVAPDELAGQVRRQPLDVLLDVLLDGTHPKHDRLSRKLDRVIERGTRPSDRRIWEALVDGARRGLHDAAIARELGLSKAAVSMAKRRIREVLRDTIEREPGILKGVVDEHELAQLGWARQSTSTRSSARSSLRSSAMAWRRLNFGRFNPTSARCRTSAAVSSSRSAA